MITIARAPEIEYQKLLSEGDQIVRSFRDAVNAKRAALIVAGTVVEVTRHGLVALQGRPEDLSSLQGACLRRAIAARGGEQQHPDGVPR